MCRANKIPKRVATSAAWPCVEDHEGGEEADLADGLGFLALGEQREERQHAALALVVRAHDERQVLHADDERDAPEHQREQPQHVRVRGRDRVRAVDALLQRVERARADVAVHDAEGREGELSNSTSSPKKESRSVWFRQANAFAETDTLAYGA